MQAPRLHLCDGYDFSSLIRTLRHFRIIASTAARHSYRPTFSRPTMPLANSLKHTLTSAVLLTSLSSAGLPAQSGGFIATLGSDTVHLERFSFESGVYRGTIVTRIPQTRLVRYTLTPA